MLCHNKNHKLNIFKVIHKDIIKILMMINIEIELNRIKMILMMINIDSS